MGKVGRPKMRNREGGGCTSANWHLINLICSQGERKQGKGHTHIHVNTHTHKREERGNWTGKWSGMYRKETWGEVLPEDIVVGLPSTTNPCPVNFMLSSPQAKRQFVSMEGWRVWLVSVTDGVHQTTRRCFYISIWSITSSLRRTKQPERESYKVVAE